MPEEKKNPDEEIIEEEVDDTGTELDKELKKELSSTEPDEFDDEDTLREKLAKANEIKENYKKEAEKNRKKRAKEALETTEVEKPATNLEVKEGLTPEDQTALKRDAIILQNHVFDEEFQGVIDNLSEAENKEFWREWNDRKPLYEEAIKTGIPVLRSQFKKRFQSCLKAVTDIDISEEARLQGAAEVQNLKKGEIKTTTIPKKGTPGVTDEDKAYAEQSGGAVSPERAKEIREAREARAKEFSA